MTLIADEYMAHGELLDVAAFHQHFEIPGREDPGFIPTDHIEFRIKFLQEELDEFREAIAAGDMLKAADALVDLEYVLKGTVIMMGLHHLWPALWDEVHQANMQKVRAKNAGESKRGSAIDVIKPPGWKPPDHSKYLGKGPWPRPCPRGVCTGGNIGTGVCECNPP